MSSKIKIPIYSNKKITKKQYRKIVNKSKYNKNICKIINSKTIKNKKVFNELIDNYNIENLKGKEFTIYPYCNEKVQFSKYVDNVNRYYINKEVLSFIKSSYNCKFKIDKKVIKKYNENYVGQKYNPCKFIEYIFKNLNNKNHFIITHSEFLNKLTTYIKYNECKLTNSNKKLSKKKIEYNEKEDIFDNLDILQLVIDTTDKYNIKYAIIRRYDEKYRLYSSFNMGTDKSISKNTKSVFLMRHCVSCHNITKNIFKKIRLGYGTYSSCFKESCEEIDSVKTNLKKIIKDYGGIKTFQFGSSIVFRAILTLLIIYNSLIKKTKIKY
jgi:hypothetical protein